MKVLLTLLSTKFFTLIAANSSFCPGQPTKGCTNGMFDEESCSCICIPPFCRATSGDCTENYGVCPEEQINSACELGVNCPWWENSLKTDTCTTGNVVPLGLWKIFGTKADCCRALFPFSDVCDVPVGTLPPSKFPSISAPEEDDIASVPIKFTVSRVPDDANMGQLKDEMKQVLKTIIVDITKNIQDLKFINIEERDVKDIQRHLNEIMQLRSLLKSVDVYFDVYLTRQGNTALGPLLIREIRENFDAIQNKLQTTPSDFFQSDIGLNFCTLDKGKYNLCSYDESPQPAPVTTSTEPAEGGMPVWAIILIVIVCLLFACCIGYFIFISIYDDDEYDKDMMRDMYTDEMKSHKKRSHSNGSRRSHRSRSSRRSRKSHRSRSSRPTDMQIVLASNQDLSLGEEFTINTYPVKRLPDPSRYPMKSLPDPSLYPMNGHDPSLYPSRRLPDPSIYNPNAVDPDGSDILMLTDGFDPINGEGERRYYEDPPLKPKREPTMYVDGSTINDPSLYSNKYGNISAKYSEKVDEEENDDDDGRNFMWEPEGNINRTKSVYVHDLPQQYEESQEHDERYDNFGYPREANTYRGSSRASNKHGDQSFYDQSYATQDPEVFIEVKSGKSSNSKRSKKSTSSRKWQSNMTNHYPSESLSSSWGDVIRGADGVMREKSKSFA